jgi:hypothetical protein
MSRPRTTGRSIESLLSTVDQEDDDCLATTRPLWYVQQQATAARQCLKVFQA